MEPCWDGEKKVTFWGWTVKYYSKLPALFSEIYFIIIGLVSQAPLKTFCSKIESSLYSEVSILCSTLVTKLHNQVPVPESNLSVIRCNCNMISKFLLLICVYTDGTVYLFNF